MIFTKPWMPVTSDEEATRVPVLDVFLRAQDGRFIRQTLIIDSGADVSMGPRALCDFLGLPWADGRSVTLRGISTKDECAVPARVHQVELYVREARCRLTLPFCLAEGDAPLLLGRDGFFDVFQVHFNKKRLLTTFEYVASEE